MTGDRIKMRSNLWEDPRVQRLCDENGQIEATVVGALYWLWATDDQHSEDGSKPGVEALAVDCETGIKGIGAALVMFDWLAETPAAVCLVRFDEHNGTSAKHRRWVCGRRRRWWRRPASVRKNAVTVRREQLQGRKTV